MREQITPRSTWLRTDARWLSDLVDVLDTVTELSDYPHADRVVEGVVVYESARVRAAIVDPATRSDVLAEVAAVFADGPGIAVFAGAFDPAVVYRVSATFESVIATQRAAGAAAGDHFAAPGANDRVWNALEKLAVTDPEGFVDYYANDLLALAATAWLGPGYQVTSPDRPCTCRTPRSTHPAISPTGVRISRSTSAPTTSSYR